MTKFILQQKEPVTFRQWSNKKYAVLSSFHKVIRIGSLALSCIILYTQPLIGQSDTAHLQKLYELEEVVALGEQDSELYSTWLRDLFILTESQLQPVSSRALPEILNQFPGVDIRTRGARGVQSDLSIRGGSFDQSMVMINGIDFSNPQTGHFNLDLPVATSQLKKIEVLTGPSMKILGANAYSGAVNLVTEPKDSFSFKGGFELGQYQSFQSEGTLHLPYKSFRNMLAFSRASSDGYRVNTDYLKNQLYFHSQFDVRNVAADVMLGYGNKNFGANSFYTPLYPGQYEETDSWLSAVKFSSSVKRIMIDGDVFWKRHADHFLLDRTNPSFYENFHLTDVLGGSVSAKMSTKIGITAGNLNYRYEQIFSTNLGKPLSEERQKGIFNPVTYDLQDNRTNLSLSLYQIIEIQRFYINGGFLLHSGIKNMLTPGIYPGLDITFRINKKLGIMASYNKSMRLPTYTDLYYQSPQNLGNPELVPETAHTTELGIKYSSGAISAGISTFHRTGNNTIDWVWNGTLWQTMNHTKLTTTGVDLHLNYQPESKELSKFVNYMTFSFSQMHLEKDDTDYISNYALDNLKQKLSLTTGINMPFKIRLDMQISRQDRNGSYLYYENPESTPQQTPYDPYWLVDLNLNRRIKRSTIYIDASNIFNIEYRNIGSVEMPGRWFMIGLKWNYN